jgi:hypothetical protein
VGQVEELATTVQHRPVPVPPRWPGPVVDEQGVERAGVFRARGQHRLGSSGRYEILTVPPGGETERQRVRCAVEHRRHRDAVAGRAAPRRPDRCRSSPTTAPCGRRGNRKPPVRPRVTSML